jgi:Transmembrane amino acid transporter protein
MEAFVARHVLCALLYQGDLGESSETRFCGRRQLLTVGIYIGTLLPALIFDDLGPVLSLTGAIGASSIAYIAPGLVYLGLNGEAFLHHVSEILDRHNGGADATNSTEGIELPAVVETNEGPPPMPQTPYVKKSTTAAAPDSPCSIGQIGMTRRKPWWWYPLLYPVWCSIASQGANNTRAFLLRPLDVQPNGDQNSTPATNDAIMNEATLPSEVIGPRPRDYYISIFFVVFGVVALVVGVISNIYVQVHDVFYTPK